jgi:hypothetical protein
MDHATPNVLAAAVRASMGESPVPAETEAPREVLQRNAEYHLFTTATLAPPASCVDKTIAALMTEVGTLHDDEAVAGLWSESLIRVLQDFANAPETWSDESTESFLLRAGTTFGVEDAHVLGLLRDFHSRDDACRFAVQVALLRSPMFDYIGRVLDEMPPEFDVDIDDPQESLRSLIRALG